MSLNLNPSNLIGKTLKDEYNREVGRIVSFLTDPSGQAKEVLVENNYGHLTRCPVDTLKFDHDDVTLVSDIDKKLQTLSDQLPVVKKKRMILSRLSTNKVIPQEIYESLYKEFDKSLEDMMSEAQGLLQDMDKQVKSQEKRVKMLQMARAFLEIEHGIGEINDEVYQKSIMSLLQEIKITQQKKLRLLRTKDKISNILMEKEEEPQKKPQLEKTIQPIKEEKTALSEGKTELRDEKEEESQAIHVRVTE